jgi:Zn-dependent protease
VTTSAPDRGTREPGQQGPDRPSRRDPKLGLVIARPFGVPVYISPYWLLFAVVLVFMYASSVEVGIGTTFDSYLVASAFVLLLYVSVLVHELAHCWVALRFGLPVRRVLLYPLGGYSEIEQEPTAPGREALIAAAGPVVSLVLAGIGYGAAAMLSPGLPALLIYQLFWANMIVGVFNLLPGLPLDGGRIFRAGVWKVTGKPVTATIVAAWAGRVLALGLVALALFGQRGPGGPVLSLDWIWLVVIAGFVWLQSSQAIKAAKIRERLPAVRARALARRAIPVAANLPLAEAVRRAQASGARALVVVDHQNTPTAIVSESAVQATPEGRRPWVEAGSLARSLVPGMVLSADLAGLDLIKAVQATPATEYLLIEPSGAVFGVLATADLDLAFAGV